MTLTPTEATSALLKLGRDIDANCDALESAEREAVDIRHAADLAEAKAFLAVESGSVEQRRREAFIKCERLLHDAEIAEAVVRHLKRRGQAISTRVDIGRSALSAIRAEISLTPYGQTA